MIDAPWSDPRLALLALLATGHLIGDSMPLARSVASRRSLRRTAGHAAFVTLVHLAAVLPLIDVTVAVAVFGIGVLHVVVDGLKGRFADSRRGDPWVVVLDQAVHLGVIAGVWLLVVDGVGWVAPRPSPGWLDAWTAGAVVTAGFAVNATGGSVIVRAVLGPLETAGDDRGDSGRSGAGRLIGVLERTLTLILILAGQWAAMALLATAKSVARFDDLKDRRFAEYYLVGTLTSLLVAVVIGLALNALGI